jgi:hypothetical protein
MIDLEQSQTTKVTIMLMIDLKKLKTTQWKQPNGSNYVNDKFEKAKNNTMVAIMLMIDLYKLKKQPNIIVMSNDRFQKVENNSILQLSE